MGWDSFVWTGGDGTTADAALQCIAGNFSVAYEWDGTSWKRYLPGRCAEVGMCTLTTVNKYDSLLVQITANEVQCTMPVVSGP
jgi:hypothetical protein